MQNLIFAVVAHVDHGKSTLSTRLVEYFRGITIRDDQFLDNLAVEKERGITVRSQAINLVSDETGTLDLIDTPGHADFSSEVKKSVSSSDLVLVLVSARDGVQPQTLAYFRLARALGKPVIFVINKVDTVNGERLMGVYRQVASMGGALCVRTLSAKSGVGVATLCRTLERYRSARHPQPASGTTRLEVLSSHRGRAGFHLLVTNRGRPIKLGVDRSLPVVGKERFRLRGIYVLSPEETPLETLVSGGIAYLVTDLDSGFRVGSVLGEHGTIAVPSKALFSTIVVANESLDSGPIMGNLYELSLNDYDLSFHKLDVAMFGDAVRCWTTSRLHLEVVLDRLAEMGTPALPITSWEEFKLAKRDEHSPLTRKEVVSASRQQAQVLVTVQGDKWGAFTGCKIKDSRVLEHRWSGDLVEVLVACFAYDFFDTWHEITSACGGMAWFEVVKTDWCAVEFRLVELYFNEDKAGLTLVVERSFGGKLHRYLEEIARGIQRRQVLINLQWRSGGKVLASHKITPYRKDVTAKCYGGDQRRQIKLLKKQKAGKAKRRGETDIGFDRDLFVKRKSRER